MGESTVPLPRRADRQGQRPVRPKVDYPPYAEADDLLKLVDLKKDKVGDGGWVKRGHALVATTEWDLDVTGWATRGETFVATAAKVVPRIEFPYVPPAEYDMRLEFVPLWCDTVGVVCAAESRQFAAMVGHQANSLAGFGSLDGIPILNSAVGRSLSRRLADQWSPSRIGRPHSQEHG